MEWLSIPDIECDMDKDAKTRYMLTMFSEHQEGSWVRRSKGDESGRQWKSRQCKGWLLSGFGFTLSDMGSPGFVRLLQGQADYCVKEAWGARADSGRPVRNLVEHVCVSAPTL